MKLSLNGTGIRLLLLFAGILFGSTAIIWIKASDEKIVIVPGILIVLRGSQQRYANR